MAFTRFDCQFYRGSSSRGDTSSFSSFSPVNEPGTLIFAGSVASKDSIGSQVACKLALEHFLSGAAGSIEKSIKKIAVGENKGALKNGEQGKKGESDGNLEKASRALEDAFKNANNSVYQFGHKLSAGGRLSTSLMGLVISDGQVAVGRVGTGSTYLCRGSHVFPFFEPGGKAGGNPGSAVGSNSLVSVELASVSLEEFDKLLILPQEIGASKQSMLLKLLEKEDVTCSEVCEEVFSDFEEIPFAFLLACGPATTYLGRSLKIASAFADN